MKCEHYYCRCARAGELAMMDCGDGRMLREAIAVHEQAVECRMPADPEQPAEPKPDL